MAARFVTSAALLAALLVGGCSGLWGDDQLDRYLQRTDRITLSAGYRPVGPAVKRSGFARSSDELRIQQYVYNL